MANSETICQVPENTVIKAIPTYPLQFAKNNEQSEAAIVKSGSISIVQTSDRLPFILALKYLPIAKNTAL